MKTFYTSILTLISLTFFCQGDKYEVAKKEFENFILKADSIQIQNIKKVDFQNISDISRYNQIVTRDLDFGLKESIFNIDYSYSFNNGFRYSNAKIHLFYYKNKIVDRLIIYEGKKLKIANKFDSEINNYFNIHNSFYNTKTTIEDFLTDILKNEIYGDGCGFAMLKVKEIDDIKLNSLENAEKYVEWMKSYSPEKQMWGFFEINKLLKNNSIELDINELKIYNHIKDRNLIIETCSGCTIGIFEKVF